MGIQSNSGDDPRPAAFGRKRRFQRKRALDKQTGPPGTITEHTFIANFSPSYRML